MRVGMSLIVGRSLLQGKSLRVWWHLKVGKSLESEKVPVTG